MRMCVDEGLQDLEDSGLTVGRGQSESEKGEPCLRDHHTIMMTCSSTTSHAY